MATIEVSEDLKAHLKALAVEFGESEERIARLAFEYGIEDVEDYFRARAASERLTRGEETTVSLEEVERRFGMAD